MGRLAGLDGFIALPIQSGEAIRYGEASTVVLDAECGRSRGCDDCSGVGGCSDTDSSVV